jgi:fructose-1,6-bisphosphatase/inositol monophosphatase family enzyme
MMEEVLLELEPKILEISNHGAEFQGQVESLRKADTGSFAADVVTKADYWVQNELLQAFASTPLLGCQLVAEESSPELAPLMERFAAQSEYQLLIDPIDGTKRFVEGLPYFSTIVSLRHQQSCLYTFCYYPKLNWWVRLLGEEGWEVSGRLPLALPTHERCVVFTSGTPDQDFADWQEQLGDWRWAKGDALHPCGSKLLYLSGSVAGYASSKPNLYDGLMIYHYAKVRRQSLREQDSQGRAHLNPDDWESTGRGALVKGRYLCLQGGAS